jgi:basic membrane protein A
VTEDVIPLVQETLAKLQSGEMDRFSIFTGPINDNKGNEIVPAGSSLTQSDLEGLQGIEGREDCTYCMGWLVEGVVPDAEIPQSGN